MNQPTKMSAPDKIVTIAEIDKMIERDFNADRATSPKNEVIDLMEL
jgi:hypothetical protein